MIEKRPIDSKRTRKLSKEHPYAGIEQEYNRYRENGKLTPKEDHLYMFFVSVSDKDGMSYYSGAKIQKYIGIGWDTFVKSMNKLSNLGLIKYEKRENHVAVQVMQVPEWEVAKHRFIEVKVEQKKENRDALLKAIAELEEQIHDNPSNIESLVSIKNRLLNDLKTYPADKRK